MHRSNWGKKRGQERVLAVRIRRDGWETLLEEGVLTSHDRRAHGAKTEWATAFESAPVHVQRDPERTLRGAPMNGYSIQVGVGRDRIQRFVDDWVLELKDMTPMVRKVDRLLKSGKGSSAKRHLPPERIYNPGHLLIGTEAASSTRRRSRRG